MPTTKVHGERVTYDEGDSEAIYHLNNRLDFYEARVIFDGARNYGKAKFEDSYRRNYTLERTRDGFSVRRR